MTDKDRLRAIARTGNLGALIQAMKEEGLVERAIGDGSDSQPDSTDTQAIGPDRGV